MSNDQHNSTILTLAYGAEREMAALRSIALTIEHSPEPNMELIEIIHEMMDGIEQELFRRIGKRYSKLAREMERIVREDEFLPLVEVLMSALLNLRLGFA